MSKEDKAEQDDGMLELYAHGDSHMMQAVPLRDFFAAAALQGMAVYWIDKGGDVRDFADSAYQMADAMLAAKEGGPR